MMLLGRVSALAALFTFDKICSKTKTSWREYSMLWYSGIMRGAIAYGLSFQIKTDKAKYIERIVLIIVLTTSILIPLFSKSFTGRIGL